MTVGFLFDLDGVIVDTAKYHYRAWRHLANQLGFDIDDDFNNELKGISRMESLELILNKGNKTTTFNQKEKDALAHEKNTYYIGLLNELSGKDMLPGVLEFITRANEIDIPCAIASASKNAGFILKKLNINKYFKSIVDPSLLRKGKPDPEIFLKAAASINVLPQNAIGFEDAQSGITALNRAGIFSIGIAQQIMQLPDANLVIPSFEKITPENVLNLKK